MQTAVVSRINDLGRSWTKFSSLSVPPFVQIQVATLRNFQVSLVKMITLSQRLMRRNGECDTAAEVSWVAVVDGCRLLLLFVVLSERKRAREINPSLNSTTLTCLLLDTRDPTKTGIRRCSSADGRPNSLRRHLFVFSWHPSPSQEESFRASNTAGLSPSGNKSTFLRLDKSSLLDSEPRHGRRSTLIGRHLFTGSKGC